MSMRHFSDGLNLRVSEELGDAYKEAGVFRSAIKGRVCLYVSEARGSGSMQFAIPIDEAVAIAGTILKIVAAIRSEELEDGEA